MVGWAAGWLLGAVGLLVQPMLPGPLAVCAFVAACVASSAMLRRPVLLAPAVGFLAAWYVTAVRLADRLDPALERQTVTIEGRVVSVPQRVGDGLRFRLEATSRAVSLPPLVELTWYEPDRPLHAAERVRVEARLRRPRGFANPGGVDLEARMLREGVGATGYVRRLETLGRDGGDVLAMPVLAARDAIAAAIREALGARPATGIIAGLAVGLQDALDPGQWRALARSGTSHLMAISGLHVGLFAIVAGGLAGRLQRWRQRRGARAPSRDVAVAAGALAALGYALLAGWSVPAQRTAIMITVASFALLQRRAAGAVSVLALGVLAVLVADPLAPLAAGFWLSFGAVGAILLVASGRVSREGWLAGYARAQWAVTVGLVPVLAGSFGAVSVVGMAVNLVAIPLYTLVIVPLVLASVTVLLAWPAVGAVLLGAVAWLVEASWPLIEVPAAWAWASWGIAGLPPLGWFALVAGAAAALAPLPAAGRVAGGLLVLSACLWRGAALAEGAARFTLLDAGQGLAAVVETRRHVLVYDAGPAFRSGSDAGALAVEPYLRHRGIRRIDRLVASHDDLDHAGGAATLARLLPVGELVASGRALDTLGPVTRCRRGDGWRWDGVEFEWLHPGTVRQAGDNDGSCVLAVRAGPHVVLLTGDIEAAAEGELAGAGLVPPASVVTVPHHGSRTSSTPPFIDAVQARWALVPAGHGNRWGFPRADVVERWRASGARVLVTSSSGAIVFEVDPRRTLADPHEWRVASRRPWRDP